MPGRLVVSTPEPKRGKRLRWARNEVRQWERGAVPHGSEVHIERYKRAMAILAAEILSK